MQGLMTAALLTLLAGTASADIFHFTRFSAEYLIFPPREGGAMSGSQFLAATERMDLKSREAAVLRELARGNVPSFMRLLVPVDVETFSTRLNRTVRATIFVTPDYLAIGSDVDFVRVPVNFYTAQRIAQDYGFALPTRKMVDEIYKSARVVLEPQPLPPGNSMITNAYFAEHNKLIEAQGDGRYVPGMLIAGHKKDIVISNKLREKPEAIAIYGWHKSDDAPIQPLSTVHGARYVDYSHGVRLVSRTVVIDGRPASISDILANPETCSLLSDEGTIIGMAPPADEEVFFAGMKN